MGGFCQLSNMKMSVPEVDGENAIRNPNGNSIDGAMLQNYDQVSERNRNVNMNNIIALIAILFMKSASSCNNKIISSIPSLPTVATGIRSPPIFWRGKPLKNPLRPNTNDDEYQPLLPLDDDGMSNPGPLVKLRNFLVSKKGAGLGIVSTALSVGVERMVRYLESIDVSGAPEKLKPYLHAAKTSIAQLLNTYNEDQEQEDKEIKVNQITLGVCSGVVVIAGAVAKIMKVF